MRLIDADAVKESIKKQVDILRLLGNDELMQYADIIQKGFFQEIDNAPTIDPQELPTAEGDWNEMIVICDCCGHAIHVKLQEVGNDSETD